MSTAPPAPPVAKVGSWQTSEVVQFLTGNGMECLTPVFEENEVSGLDLLLLTEDELRSMLHVSKLQAQKIKSLVNAMGAPSSDDADAASAPPADDDPAAHHDFSGSAVPRITDRDEDLGEGEEERAELRRAGSGIIVGNQPSAATAASAPSWAHNVPLLPVGTGALQLDAGTVQHYKESVATIVALEGEHVAQRLPAASSRLAAVQKRLKLQEAKFEALREEEAKRNQKLDKLVDGKWYPGKYLLGSNKHEGKVRSNTEKLEKISNQVKAAGAQLEELHQEMNALSMEVSELTAKCASLDQARNFCASLLQSAFAGRLVGDARENWLESEVATLGPSLEEVRRYKAVYSKAYELMRESRKALDQAEQVLSTASGLATIDMMDNVFSPAPFRSSPGGLLVDIIKRQQMRQGVQLCKVAGELAIKARALVPDMPRVKAEKLQSLRTGFGLMDVVFDNMISDMIVMGRIRKMLGALRDVQADVKYAERWLEGWTAGRIDKDMRNLEAQLAAKRKELHDHRTMLMQQWIEAKERGAVLEAPVAAVGVPVGQPVHGYIV